MIQVGKKFKNRSSTGRANGIEVYNLFENLEVECQKETIFQKEVNKDTFECMLMVGKRNIFKKINRRIHPRKIKESVQTNKDHIKNLNNGGPDEDLVSNREYENKFCQIQPNIILTSNNCLKKFETGNRSEEDLVKILNTPKQSLKKCRNCNFKKRRCILNPSSCKSRQSFCTKCKTLGHFPKSINCKSKRRSTKPKMPVIKNKNSCKRDVLILLNKRIKQLEVLSQIKIAERKEETSVDQILKQTVPENSIPFVMMYIFLNHGFIFPGQFELKKRVQEFSTEAIMNEANYFI